MTLTHAFAYSGLHRLSQEYRKSTTWEQQLEIEKSKTIKMFARQGLTVTRIEAKYTGAFSSDDSEHTTMIETFAQRGPVKYTDALSDEDGERTSWMQGEAVGPQTGTKAEENRTRRWCFRLGLRLRKSRARHIKRDDIGGYCLKTEYGRELFPCGGFSCSLSDVEAYLATEEARIVKEATWRKEQ